MFFVVRCGLFVVYCLLFGVCEWLVVAYLLSVVCSLLCGVCLICMFYLRFVVCGLLSGVDCRLPFIGDWLLSVVCCSLRAVCR